MHLRNVAWIWIFTPKDERSLDEVFPWDFIDTGVTKEFLKREWQNAMEENVTPNCGCAAPDVVPPSLKQGYVWQSVKKDI